MNLKIRYIRNPYFFNALLYSSTFFSRIVENKVIIFEKFTCCNYNKNSSIFL